MEDSALHSIDEYGNTALHLSAIHNDYALSAMLILRGVSPLTKNKSSISPFEIAQTLGHTTIIHLFDMHGYKPYQKKKPFNSKKQQSRVQLLDGPNTPAQSLNFPKVLKDTGNDTVFGYPVLVLLNALQPKAINNQTLLMKAAFKNYHESVASLLTPESVLDIDIHGASALHWSVIGQSHESIRLILTVSLTHINTPIHTHYTPIIIAAYNGDLETMKILIEFGAVVESSATINAMSAACWYLNVDAVAFLIKIEIPLIANDAFISGVASIWTDSSKSSVSIIESKLDGINLASFMYIAGLINHKDRSPSIKQPRPSSLYLPHIKQLQVIIFPPQLTSKDYLIDQQPLIDELTHRLSSYSTLLSTPLQKVIAQSFKMIHATHQSQKDTYITITGNLLQLLSELISLIMTFEPAASSPSAGLQDTIFTTVFKHIAEVVKECTDLSKKLVLNTRLAMGVWPSPKSVTEIKMICGTIVQKSVDLVHMIHATGLLPLLDTPVNSLIEELINPPVIDMIDSVQEIDFDLNDDTRLLTFQDYKKRHEQQVMKEVARIASLSTSSNAQDEFDAQSRLQLHNFHASLNTSTLPIVLSIRDLKDSITMHIRDLYANHASAILARIEYLIAEIEQYPAFQELDERTLLEEEDLEAFEVEGEASPILRDSLPYPFKPILSGSIKKLRKSAQMILQLSMNAAPTWIPNSSASAVVKAFLPCCLDLKFLVKLAIQISGKILKDSTEESRMREMWRRKCLQSEKVKDMFKLWQTQLKMGDTMQASSAADLEFLKDSEEGLVFESILGSKIRLVKGGMLLKLVERMTSVVGQDPALNACLLMSHHSYSTSIMLFDSLIKRYDITPPFGLNQVNFDAFVQRKVLPIRVNVCSTIQTWIEHFYREDYHSNPALIKKLLTFIKDRLMVDLDKIAETLYTLLQEKAALQLIPPTRIQVNLPDPTIDFLETDPKLLAKQLTLIEHTLFSKIKVYECSDQIWGDKRKKELSKIEGGVYDNSNLGMTAMIKHTNELTMWIASRILVGDSAKSRVNCIKYFTAVAAACRELSNYNAITAISAAMSVAPIGRLYKTWARSMPKTREDLTMLCDLVSPKGQYANYRRVLKELKVPAIPFLGVYLTDLTFLELGNGDFLPDSSYINVDKRRKVYLITKEIERFQTTGYAFEDETAIQAMPHFWEGDVEDENVLYDRSLVVEPRKEEDE